jgi:glycosyltransferase involved in cell wall biosynthesis
MPAVPAVGSPTVPSPCVSVITIFFNAERYLSEAVASVWAQDYPDWELLLVDDGSTDAGTAVARRLAEQQPGRVRYLEHPEHQNRGMSASRNVGLRAARGTYVAFLDADDVWLPHKLSRQITLMEQMPTAVMSYGATEYWYSWTGDPADQERDHPLMLGVEPDSLVLPPELLLGSLRGTAAPPCPSDMLVRRAVLEKVGGFEESFRGLYEDQVMFAKVSLAGPVFVSTERWARYRQHPDSCCSVADRTGVRDAARRHFLEWLERYVAASAPVGGELRQVVRRALRPYRRTPVERLLVRARTRVTQAIRAALGATRSS